MIFNLHNCHLEIPKVPLLSRSEVRITLKKHKGYFTGCLEKLKIHVASAHEHYLLPP